MMALLGGFNLVTSLTYNVMWRHLMVKTRKNSVRNRTGVGWEHGRVDY